MANVTLLPISEPLPSRRVHVDRSVEEIVAEVVEDVTVTVVDNCFISVKERRHVTAETDQIQETAERKD
jgi:hypothetical protein